VGALKVAGASVFHDRARVSLAGLVSEHLFSTCDRDWRVAIHEASHATVAYLQGQRVFEATIVPCPEMGSGGHVLTGPRDLAGSSKQPRPKRLKVKAPSDITNTAQYAMAIAVLVEGRTGADSRKRAHQFIRVIRAEVRGILTDHGLMVRALARELVDCRTLNERRINRVLRKAYRTELTRSECLRRQSSNPD
jgi:hypothetical protein